MAPQSKYLRTRCKRQQKTADRGPPRNLTANGLCDLTLGAEMSLRMEQGSILHADRRRKKRRNERRQKRGWNEADLVIWGRKLKRKHFFVSKVDLAISQIYCDKIFMGYYRPTSIFRRITLAAIRQEAVDNHFWQSISGLKWGQLKNRYWKYDWRGYCSWPWRNRALE